MLTTLTALVTKLQDAAGQVADTDPAAGTSPADLLATDPLADPVGWIDKVVDWAVAFAPSLVGAVLTLIIGLWVAKLLTKGVRAMLGRANVDQALSQFLGTLVYYGLVAVVLVAAVGKLGVQTTSFVAILGAAGLAVGFALQGSLGNLAAGVMILLFRPFRVGDYVEAGGQAGAVKEMGVFATTLNTPDNRKIILPNSAITGGAIVNYSAFETRRVEVVFGISYDDDIAKARGIIQDVIAKDARILKDPAPAVLLAELADSSVNFKTRVWCKTSDFWGVNFDLIENVKLAFDAGGITIPYPQQDVHHHGSPS
ncbi:MAG: mechanosensitive ion channel family protein [Planctomycetota bacterium]|jgi:small conductance mechanosensitive channel